MNSTVDVKSDSNCGIDDVKLIDGGTTIEKVKDSHESNDKNKEIVKINKEIDIENNIRSGEEKEKDEISENFADLYHKKIVKILPDNCGTIFSIEASTDGASF